MDSWYEGWVYNYLTGEWKWYGEGEPEGVPDGEGSWFDSLNDILGTIVGQATDIFQLWAQWKSVEAGMDVFDIIKKYAVIISLVIGGFVLLLILKK